MKRRSNYCYKAALALQVNTLETGQTGNQPEGSDNEEKNGDGNVTVVRRINDVIEEEGQHYSNDDAPPASAL